MKGPLLAKYPISILAYMWGCNAFSMPLWFWNWILKSGTGLYFAEQSRFFRFLNINYQVSTQWENLLLASPSFATNSTLHHALSALKRAILCWLEQRTYSIKDVFLFSYQDPLKKLTSKLYTFRDLPQGYSAKFYTGRHPSRSNPLPFYILVFFLQKRFLLRMIIELSLFLFLLYNIYLYIILFSIYNCS